MTTHSDPAATTSIATQRDRPTTPRILVVEPGVDFSVSDVHRGIIRGLHANGANVANFGLTERLDTFARCRMERPEKSGNYDNVFDDKALLDVVNEMLLGMVLQFDPDVVVIVMGSFITERTLDVLRHRRAKVASVLTEQPYELTRETWLSERSDFTFMNDPSNIDRFRAVCAESHYLPHGYDPDIHYPGPRHAERPLDAFWCGTAYRSRLDFFEQVTIPDDMNLVLAGNWQTLDTPDGFGDIDDLAAKQQARRYLMHPDNTQYCLPNVATEHDPKGTVDFYRDARLSWNTYRRESESDAPEVNEGWSVGPREIELAATGVCFARESRPEGDELFPMLPIIDTPGDLTDFLRWGMDNPEAAEVAAGKATEAVADRSFTNTTAEMLRVFGY